MEPVSMAAKDLIARTVHVKLYPTPQSFPERRQVLRVLESFGEVASFRSLKYNRAHQNPVRNAFIALFATQSAADEALSASPLSYELTLEAPPPDPNSPTPGITQPQTKSIEMSLNKTTFSHVQYLSSGSRNPLHGPFKPVYFKHSYIASALEASIPESLWSAGMRDWETDKGMDVDVDEGKLSSAGDGGERNYAGLGKAEDGRRARRSRPEIMNGLRRFVGQ